MIVSLQYHYRVPEQRKYYKGDLYGNLYITNVTYMIYMAMKQWYVWGGDHLPKEWLSKGRLCYIHENKKTL